MKAFTRFEIADGVMAVRSLSDKARKFYNGNDIIVAVRNGKYYAYYDLGYSKEYNCIEDLDKAFCEEYNELEAINE